MWIRLSGASKDLLDETGKFKQKESIKYARYGRLVLIPAILGGIAGTYAFSVILDNIYACLAFGVLWFFIVFAVDMAMSATLYKTKNGSAWGFRWSVFARLVFSVLVGMVVSHPLVLRIFEPSIEANLVERDTAKKNADILDANTKVSNAGKPFDEKITHLKNLNLCLSRLIQFERSIDNTYAKEFTIPSSNIPCGSASGYGKGCSGECKQREKEVVKNTREIAKLEQDKANAIKPQTTILGNAEQNRSTAVTKDYLARTEALDLLSNGDGKSVKGHPHVWIANQALIWFFVVLDCLIVIFKAATPMGALEHTSDILLEWHIEEVRAKKEAQTIYIKTIANGKAKVQAAYEVKIAEILSTQHLVSGTIQEYERDIDKLKIIKKRMLRDAGLFNLKRRSEIKKQIFKMEHLMDLARAKTFENLSKSL